MARIRVSNAPGTEVSAGPAVSVLNSLVKEGVPIRHDCGGKAQCGMCRVRIVSGTGGLSPVSEKERTRLEKSGAGASDRLACQTHAARDIEIEIVNY